MSKAWNWIERFDRTSPRFWLVVLLVVTLLVRLVLFILYAPIIYNDTPSYRRLAEAVARGFAGYDGTRTPGYPMLLALLGPDRNVWLAQMGMGVVITLLLFSIVWLISRRAWVGGIVALAHTLNLQQLFFEPDLLTETPATFWIVLATAGLVLWIAHPHRRSIWLAIVLGISSSMAWLTRPLFIYFPFWILLFLVVVEKDNFQLWRRSSGRLFEATVFRSIARWLVFFVFAAGSVAGWIFFIHDNFHDWGLTTMTGFQLVQHTGSFFEYVPDKYAALRDTYIKIRDAHITQYGTQANTIWEAIPALQKASGKSFYDLSRLLARISLQLIGEHPDLYLRNVTEGWWWFWRPPVYWDLEQFRWQAAHPVLRVLGLAWRAGLFACNLLFILSTVMAVVWKRIRVVWQIGPAMWFIAGTVWIASILQTLTDHGDNVRFLVPLQSMVLLWVALVVFATLLARRLRVQKSPVVSMV